MMDMTITHASTWRPSLNIRNARAMQLGRTSSSSSNTEVAGGGVRSIGGSINRDRRAVEVGVAVGGGLRLSGGGRVPRAIFARSVLIGC